MIEALSLDQLRVFIAAAETGIFSAAGRKLRRAQSLVSQSVANLEGQLKVKLFDRSAKYPVLTGEGEALDVEAKAVIDRMDGFKARARTRAEGLQPQLSGVACRRHPLAAPAPAGGLLTSPDPSTPLSPSARTLAAGGKRWVKIRIGGAWDSARMRMHAVYRKDAPRGPAGRAFIQRLKVSS